MLFAKSREGGDARSPSAPGHFPRRSWGNWALLAASFIATTIGLAVIVATLLPSRLVNPWPWVRTDLALVVAVLFLVLTLVLYLTHEQNNMNRFEQQFTILNNEIHERARRRLFALLDMSRVIATQEDSQSVFDCITRSCVEAFDCDQSSLMLFDAERRVLVVRSAYGHQDITKILGQEQAIGIGIAGWAALHEKPVVIGREERLAENPALKLSAKHLSAAVVVPILLRDELVGIVNISSRAADVVYDQDDVRALSVFAENAGTCIRNAERSQWMRATIESLRAQVARASESVSP
jgi:transcriptional regulator with GAF, ATPase, and Fis domain